jgi:hypothetical protein
MLDLARLTTLGGQIAALGTQLNDLRGQRDALSLQVVALEQQITPLLLEHAQIIAAITQGMGGPPPSPTSALGQRPPHQVAAPAPSGDPAMKARIKAFLKSSGKGMSALEVGDALRIDSMLVREVLVEMRGDSPAELQPVEDEDLM